MSEREFYVGYQPKAPEGLARFRKRVGIVLVVGVIAAMTVLALAQRRLPGGEFDFGQPRTWEGVYYNTPVPMLVSAEDGNEPSATVVGPYKYQVPGALIAQHGKRVRFEGTRIEAGGFRMIEVTHPESIETIDDTSQPPPERIDGGEVTLSGELVDTKCFLGVMRPGQGKAHMACANVCLMGGIPPVFVVYDGDGGSELLLLADANGRPVTEAILDRTSLYVSVEGAVEQRGTLKVFRIDPASLEVL